MKRLWLAGLLCAALPALAQSDWQREAVPFYTTPTWVAAQRTHLLAPAAKAFAASAAELSRTLDAGCGEAAQRAWRATVVAWDRAATVATGPLVTRRSARQIDFSPTRPERIRSAIANGQNPEEAGAAARGLPALEWLLFRPAEPGPPDAASACAYARQVGAHLRAEADAVAAGFAAAKAADDDEALAQAEELVNQWLTGAEAFRLGSLVRPMHEGESKGQPPQWPRALGGAVAQDRAARWQALRQLAVRDAAGSPDAEREVVPLESVLRGRGLNALADRLVARARAVSGPLESGDAAAAAAALGALHALVQDEVAGALDLRLGFSDADGD